MRMPYINDAKTVIRNALFTLSPRHRSQYYLAISITSLLALLDLVGVASIAGIAALGSSAVQGETYPPFMQSVIEFLSLEELTVTQLAAVLGLLSAVFMSAKSIFSLQLNRRILRFLANRENEFVSGFVDRLFRLPYLKITQKSSGEYINILTHSANSLITGTLGYLSFILVDLSVLIVMTIALFLADPITCLFTLIYFSLITTISFLLTRRRSKELSQLTVKNNIEVFATISDAINGYKEAKSTDKIQKFVGNIKRNRSELPKIVVEQMQLTLIPKYFMEIGLIVGVIFVSALQFLRTDSSNAVTVLAVFFIASSRITPSLLRIQNSFLLLVQAKTASDPLLETLQTIQIFEKRLSSEGNLKGESPKGFEIELKDVALQYPGKNLFALSAITLKVPEGTSLGIVGRSGSGKTSLVDLVLGLLEPTSGKVSVGGVSPHLFLTGHEGLFAYVPQTIYIKSATILENVAFGVPVDQISHERVWEALTRANLKEFVESLDEGLNHKLGERGIFISGGQRQRINIARALYFQPKILVLDEATSALDIETEVEINRVINNLKGVTRIVIAHRLTAVQKLDQIAVLEEGILVELDSYVNLMKRDGSIFKRINETFFNSSS
jgi:ABC-type multidrug transport system fused ATPase/permease subunit